jgi:hypothetical protein
MAQEIKMAEDTLDNAVSSLIPEESSTQTEETTPVASETNIENQQNGPANADNQAAKGGRANKYDSIKKSYDELRSFTDRKNNEYVQKIKALEDRMQKYAPYEQYMPQLQAVLEEKRKQELAQQYQQNPLQTQQQLMEQMLNERLAPFQQQQAMAQNEQVVNQNIDWMKQTYGEEAFKDVSPYMGQILENTRQQHGDQVADLLARSPEHLFTAAFGYLALNKIKEFNSQKQAGTQNKANLAQQSAGVARPNRTSRSAMPTSNNAIEQAAFDFLKQNS